MNTWLMAHDSRAKAVEAARWMRVRSLAVALVLSAASAFAQERSPRQEHLGRSRYKNGAETLRAFGPIAEKTRWSVAKLDVDGKTVALATIVDTNGLALTKASQLKSGKLTAWLAGGREVEADLLEADDEADVALVKVHSADVNPIVWASGEVRVGMWAVTPGIEIEPQAVGIISGRPRRILPRRALIGVQLDLGGPGARVSRLMPGLGAEKAGLKPGDVIVALNGQELDGGGEELMTTLREMREGQSVTVRVLRADQQFEVSIPLAAEPVGRGINREDRLNRMGGDVSERAEGFESVVQHDTVLQPWLCGGPLVNLDGEAIGLNIARAGRVASYALPAEAVERILDRLRKRAGGKNGAPSDRDRPRG